MENRQENRAPEAQGGSSKGMLLIGGPARGQEAKFRSGCAGDQAGLLESSMRLVLQGSLVRAGLRGRGGPLARPRRGMQGQELVGSPARGGGVDRRAETALPMTQMETRAHAACTAAQSGWAWHYQGVSPVSRPAGIAEEGLVCGPAPPLGRLCG